jgi:uncharacterized protein YjbI with pentapeptide repeats
MVSKSRPYPLESAILSLAGFDSSDASHANLRHARLTEAIFKGVDLHEADLEGAKLVMAEFTRVNFEKAVLKNTTMSGAVFTKCNLRAADLTGADLEAVEIYQPQGLTPHQLSRTANRHLLISPFNAAPHKDG